MHSNGNRFGIRLMQKLTQMVALVGCKSLITCVWDAARVIAGLKLTGDNYAHAIDLLKAQYTR